VSSSDASGADGFRERDDLLAFLVLDVYLANIAQCFQAPLELVRAVCLLQRKSHLQLLTGLAEINCITNLKLSHLCLKP